MHTETPTVSVDVSLSFFAGRATVHKAYHLLPSPENMPSGQVSQFWKQGLLLSELFPSKDPCKGPSTVVSISRPGVKHPGTGEPSIGVRDILMFSMHNLLLLLLLPAMPL